MIPGTIHTNQGELSFELPTSWKDITVSQLITMQKEELSNTDMLVLLTGLEEWYDAPLGFVVEWTAKLAPLYKEKAIDWFTLPVERTVTLGGKEIEYPKDITVAPGRAVENLRNEIELLAKQENPNQLNIIPTTLALLAVKPYYGKYGLDGYDKAQELLPLVNKMPAAIGFPLANFFLGVSKKRPKSGPNSLGINLLRNKLKQAYKSLQGSEAS